MSPTIDFEPIAFEPEQPEAIDFQVDFEPDTPAAMSDPGAAARREAMNRTLAGVQEVPLATRLAAGAYSGIQKGLYTPDKLVLGAIDLALGSVGAGDTSFGQRVAGKLKAINDRDMALAEQDRQMFGNDPASQLTEGIGRAATELPLYLVPGGGAATPASAVVRSALAGGVVGGGTQYAQDRGEGKGRAVSALYGLNSGAITALTTRAFGATGAESIFRTEGVQGIRNRLLAVFKDAGMEGAEETVDQVQQDLLERITREPNKPLGQSLTEALMAFAVGVGLGGGVGVTVGAADAVGDVRAERAANREFDARSQTVAQNKATLAGVVREPIQFVPDDFGQKQPSPSRNPPSASSAGLTQSGAAGATPATPDNQSAQVRAELEALPGAESDLKPNAGSEPSLVSGALDRARQASTTAATPDNTPATKADLQALADFIQNGGNNPFAPKPASAPADVTEKPAQTTTGSNVQTGTEMPVQATPGAATTLPPAAAGQTATATPVTQTALPAGGTLPAQPKAKNLPTWAREEMIRRGLDPARPLNDQDIQNPSIRAAIENDPTLTPEQKKNLLANGQTLPAIPPAQGGENANGQEEKGRETLLNNQKPPGASLEPPAATFQAGQTVQHDGQAKVIKRMSPDGARAVIGNRSVPVSELAAIPVKQGGRKRFLIQPRSDGIADVLDAIQEEGGLRSPTAADVSDGDYDGFKEAMIGPAALLRRRTEGHHPTDIVKAIQAEFPRIKTSGDLYQAIRDAVAQRDNLRRNGGGAEAQQQRFWDAATAPKSTSGLVKINANQLAIGHTFRLRAPGVSHEELTVTHIDADTGEVQVKDGTSFGVQDLPDGAEIWVQKKGLAPELNRAQVKPTDAPPVANPTAGNQPAVQPGGKPKTGGVISPPVTDPGILRARERLERQLRTIAGAEAGTIRLASGPVSNPDGHSRGRSLAADLQSVAHVFGKSVVWFTTHNVEPGRQVYGWGGDPSGKYIFVSAEHPLTALGTTFHELLHQFQKSNPDLYADFKKEMLAMARIPGSEYERLKRYAGYKGDLGDELLADFAGDAFNDPKFLRDFATRNPGLFRRVVNRLIRFLNKVLTQLTRASKASREVFDDLQAARDRLAKAMADWAADEASVRQVRADIDKANGENKQFSIDRGNDLFSAPESVADQKARLDREKRATDERKAKEAMQARAAARLTGKDIDTTQDAFANDATTRLDKSGQGSFFRTDMDEPGPLWRSNMQDALATWQPKGTPQQLLAHLAKTKGAMDEAEWIGLDEFLKDKPSVTKAQVQEFIKANTVDVREKMLGDNSHRYALEQEWNDLREKVQAKFGADYYYTEAFVDSPERVRMRQIETESQAIDSASEGKPKFENYQLPGGGNYRELLLTMPEKKRQVTTRTFWDSARQNVHGDRKWYRVNRDGEWDTVPFDSQQEAESRMRDEFRTSEVSDSKNNFQSSHFDEPNILAHVRFNERTDADGKRVLFLEEVQSDWHQRGRKDGYAKPPATAEQKATAVRRIESINVELNRLARQMARTMGEQRAALAREYNGYLTERDGIRDSVEPTGVPDAPFKQTWPLLAMKRMIRYAAEHGFDRIGWTTGDQQAERYDLSKQVDSIRLTKKASGSYTIEVTRNGRSEAELIKDGVKPNDLGDYIGKELASKALAAPEQEEQVFAGDNLRVGGKGMRKFYDEMLPSEVNKFVKKWGGRVGQGIIGKEYNVHEDLDGGYVVVDASKDPLSTSSVVKTFATIEAAEGYAKGLSIESEKVHTLDITPAMRESAMQGMPMFSTDFDPPDVATLDKLKSDITAAEQALKTAVRAAVNPNRAIPRADADQAAALATANLRALQDEYDKHPDRLRAMPLPELEAHAQATAARLAEIAETPVAVGSQLPDDLRGERWRLMREAKRIAAERWNRPEIVADALRKAEKLTNDLRAATKARDATAMRHAIEELQALQDAEFTQIKPALLAAVRADLEAKGEIKPLAVDKRGRTLADLTDWMKARKLDSPKLTLKERVNLAKRLADEFNAGKDKLTHALVRSRAMWQAFKAQWKAPLKDDSVRSIFKEWHYEKQFSGIETHQFASKLRADIPKKVRRMAISVWLDANGDRGLLTAQKMDVPARFLPVWTAALNLTADEKALAMRLKQDFAQKLADGQLLGLIEKVRDSYGVPQIWEVLPQHGEDYAGGDGKSKRPRNPGAKLDPRDPFFALKRTHDTYFDGIMAGGIPRSLDIADLVGVYNVEFHGALADRSVIKALKDAKMPDNTAAVKVSGGAKIEVLPTGARVQFVDSNWKPADAVAADGRPYRAVDHWALRGWKFAATDAAGNPIMVQGDFLVHPDLYAKIKTQLEGKSALRDPEGPLGAIAHITGGLLKSGAFLKASKFASATFHGATLAEHMMTHAFSGMPSRERLALLNPYVGGVEINPAKDREVANLIRHGMDMGFGGYQAMFEEGLTSHGGIWAHVPGLGDGMAWLSDGMFKEYLPRLKVKLGKAALHANRARYSSKLTEQQIYELTASQVNAAFGGQNWALLGRSKTFLDVNRLFLTAPDFLLSRAKVVGQALKPYNREQMLFILAQAALVYGAARIFNLLLDDDPHWEPENALQVIHGGKAWSARFIVNDMLHAVTDPAGFASGRLGPWPRTGFEMITGRDMRTGARKDVPIDTENPAFRAAQIAAVDLAQWLIPVGADGLLPGATGREQTGPGQFALGLVGVGSRRYTAETEMFQLAAKFNRGSEDPRANRQQKMRDDAPKQQSAYRKLDVLLEADDLAGARKEYAALQKEGHTKDAIAARMKAITDGHLAHPFTGSQEREKQFKASLTPEQRMEYERAVVLRKERAAKFSRMLQTTQ